MGCVLKLVDCARVRLTISADRSAVVKQLALSFNTVVGQLVAIRKRSTKHDDDVTAV